MFDKYIPAFTLIYEQYQNSPSDLVEIDTSHYTDRDERDMMVSAINYLIRNGYADNLRTVLGGNKTFNLYPEGIVFLESIL